MAIMFVVLPPGLGLTSIAHSATGPSMDAVMTVLKKAGFHDIESKKISVPSSSSSSSSSSTFIPSIVNFIKEHDQPVFLLHYPNIKLDNANNREYTKTTTTTTDVIQHRRLTNSSDTAPPTEYEISAYQIGLWTSIGMIVLIASAVSALSNMEIIPDSLLFAKFQSSRTNKND